MIKRVLCVFLQCVLELLYTRIEYVCVCVSVYVCTPSLFCFSRSLSLSFVNMLKIFSHVIGYSHHSSLLVSFFLSWSSCSSSPPHIVFWLNSLSPSFLLLDVMLPICSSLFSRQIPVVVGRVALVFSLIYHIQKERNNI